MSTCRGCRRPTTPGALSCSSCGQRHPAGVLPFLALGVLALFGLAVLGGVAQGLFTSKEAVPASSSSQWRVVEGWGVGLYGVGEALVLPRSLVTEAGMERVRTDLRARLEDRSFVQAYLFVDAEAVRLREAGLAGELGERQEWFDRALVGLYERNDRLGLERLTYAPGGIPMSDDPRVLEW